MRRDAEVVRRLVRMVAREPAPQLDWGGIERAVFERLDAEPVAAPVLAPALWPRLLGVAAVAAGIAAIVGFGLPSRPLGAYEPATPVAGTIAASTLGAATGRPAAPLDAPLTFRGVWLAADTRPLAVRWPGRATCTLGTGTRAHVEPSSPAIVVRLEQGSLRAEVVPSPEAETFVVRVGETAVAVHGTAFTVERVGDRAVVEVEHGSVVIGSYARRGTAPRWLMLGPSRASFSLDGARVAAFDGPAPRTGAGPVAAVPRERATQGGRADPVSTGATDPAGPSAPVAAASRPAQAPLGSKHETASPANGQPPTPAALAASGAASPEGAPADAHAAELAESLSAEAARPALDALRVAIRGCLASVLDAPSREGVKVSVQTTVHITVAPDGHVSFGRFDPPLGPKAQACASEALVKAKFPPARSQSSLRLPLRF
jgi:hypothetical protein